MAGAELFIGGRFATSIIGKVLNLGCSYLRDNKDLHTGTKEMLENLEIQLPSIQSVIEAAEKRQITGTGLTNWLELLKNAAYEAADVVDDFEAKRIRESIKGKGKVSEIASSSVKMVKTLFFSDHDLKKLKSVVNKFDKVCKGMGVFIELIHNNKGKEHLDNPVCETSSNLAPGVKIIGRDREIGLIWNMISNVLILYGGLNHEDLDDSNSQQRRGEASSSSGAVPGKSKFSEIVIKVDASETHSISKTKPVIIPIVGVGGVGKTAVAKMIYNKEGVKKHFALRAWVYVSENCDAKKIMQDILCSFGGGMPDPLMNLENVGKKLKETIKNHRFLIILDDLRDMTKLNWKELVSVLYNGEIGSVVVVTTQDIKIANTIKTMPEVTLDLLQKESFWKLFEHYAFAGFETGESEMDHLQQQEVYNLKFIIGKKIAEKLHGLPLAGEVIGTLLNKKLEKKFWKDILESDWWAIEDACKEILPSISISYNYLDPELKQCFVFCSIFPKQYVFERERLVQMWIAHDFIQPGEVDMGRLDRGETRLEDIGREWFDKLVDRSFFQPTLCDGKYVMHDLVRDLAIAVSSNEFCFVKSQYNHLPLLARHMGIDCDNSAVEGECQNSTRLRTVLLFGNWTNCSAKSISNIFAKYNGLRLLDLSYIWLETNEPINAACQLSHLRFVDLSFTGIKSIPDEFCALCHLEVLDVRGCKFDKLPQGMYQLVNMRHLYASADSISLISSIGKLTKLQRLKEFRVGASKGHKISELRDMNEISGHLLLTNLHNVSSEEEAVECQLDKKKYLKSLELRFGYSEHGPRTEVKMEVLNALKPNHNLEILKVGGCRWKYFPGWVFFPQRNLKVIQVYCFEIERLPSFGELPFLEVLSFDDLPLIKTVGSEFYGSSDVIFPSLRELTFSEMSSWEIWEDAWDRKSIFPELKKLHLKGCKELYRLPVHDTFPTSVVELILSECPNLGHHAIQRVLQRMPSLSHLSITGSNIVHLRNTTLNFLEVMHISGIEALIVEGTESLINLRNLALIDIDRIYLQENNKQCFQFVTDLHLGSNRIQNLSYIGMLPSLRTLLITDYHGSEYMRDEESWFNQLTSLKRLEFRNCFELRCLPSQLHTLISLKKLHIDCCPEILSLPANGLPQSLEELCIDKCPNLIHRCQPNQGEDWHKIAHIPFRHLDSKMGTIQIPRPDRTLQRSGHQRSIPSLVDEIIFTYEMEPSWAFRSQDQIEHYSDQGIKDQYRR